MSTNRVNTIEDSQDDSFPAQSTPNLFTQRWSAVNINLKLRTQAKKLGLIPGSPSWRAYVLGTLSAMEKRKREKRQSVRLSPKRGM